MKKPTQKLIKSVLRRSKTFASIKREFIALGFSLNTDGGNKHVFIHPKWKYVVKFVWCSDEIPEKDNKISKYYLYPKKVGTFKLSDLVKYRNTTVLLQEKVEPVTDEECDKFYNKLDKKGIQWWDCHAGNMGRLGKKLVIIDY